MKKQKFLSILLIVLPALAIALTALPNAVRMRFFAGENGYFIEYVSGFARVPMGYGLVSPGFAGTCACVAALFGILRWKTQAVGYTKRLRNFACIGAACWCLCGLQESLTYIGIGAFLLLAAAAGIAQYLCKEDAL